MSRVLIIDDDPIHQRIVQIMIAKHHIYDDYISFTEAEKALEFLNQQADHKELLPDVILLDLNMPVVDGWDFLEAFEKIAGNLKKEIRIFIVTSSVDEKDKQKSHDFTMVKGFISKPLSTEMIRDTLN